MTTRSLRRVSLDDLSLEVIFDLEVTLDVSGPAFFTTFFAPVPVLESKASLARVDYGLGFLLLSVSALLLPF